MRFRQWLESGGSGVSVAHVGWTGNNFDVEMQATAYDFLRRRGFERAALLGTPAQRDDYVNLHDGRDFLAEDGGYDVVILYHVYCAYGAGEGPTKELSAKNLKDAGAFAVSQRHCVDAWRRRLKGCWAEAVICFGQRHERGGPTEIRGDYLGDVPTYTREEHPGFTAYLSDTFT